MESKRSNARPGYFCCPPIVVALSPVLLDKLTLAVYIIHFQLAMNQPLSNFCKMLMLWNIVVFTCIYRKLWGILQYVIFDIIMSVFYCIVTWYMYAATARSGGRNNFSNTSLRNAYGGSQGSRLGGGPKSHPWTLVNPLQPVASYANLLILHCPSCNHSRQKITRALITLIIFISIIIQSMWQPRMYVCIGGGRMGRVGDGGEIM